MSEYLFTRERQLASDRRVSELLARVEEAERSRDLWKQTAQNTADKFDVMRRLVQEAQADRDRVSRALRRGYLALEQGSRQTWYAVTSLWRQEGVGPDLYDPEAYADEKYQKKWTDIRKVLARVERVEAALGDLISRTRRHGCWEPAAPNGKACRDYYGDDTQHWCGSCYAESVGPAESSE